MMPAVIPSSEAELNKENPAAPWYGIENRNFVSVEHPGIVRNIDSVISSLGGKKKIESFLDSDSTDRCLGLFLRPEDPFRRPIDSRILRTANIFFKASVPRRTGRKRKRGSYEPFTQGNVFDQQEDNDDTHQRLQSFRDNPDTSRVEAIGSIEETHRFRATPDFQFSVANNSLVQSLKGTVLEFEYDKLKDFNLDTRTRGVQPGMDMIPPPSLSQRRLHFNYAYHQNPSVKLVQDESGKQITINTAWMPKTANQLVPFDVEVVPDKPDESLPPIETLHPRMQNLVKQIREMFVHRPILTRRVLYNRMPRERPALSRRVLVHKASTYDNEYDLKYAVRFVCYMFRSGPWKDALIRLGVDPRADAAYRVYQTVAFQIEDKEKPKIWEDGRLKWQRSMRTNNANAESHMFDGKNIRLDGKIWQVCDITDPILRKLLEDDPIRSTCDTYQDGWYNNGTWAKLRVIMRDKIATLMSSTTPDDLDYIRVCQMPPILDKNNPKLGYIASPATAKEQALASQVRNLAKQVEGYTKKLELFSAELHGTSTGTANEYSENEEIDGDVLFEDATAVNEEEDDNDDNYDEASGESEGVVESEAEEGKESQDGIAEEGDDGGEEEDESEEGDA